MQFHESVRSYGDWLCKNCYTLFSCTRNSFSTRTISPASSSPRSIFHSDNYFDFEPAFWNIRNSTWKYLYSWTRRFKFFNNTKHKLKFFFFSVMPCASVKWRLDKISMYQEIQLICTGHKIMVEESKNTTWNLISLFLKNWKNF